MKLDREFLCLQPSLARLYSAAAWPSERLRSDGPLAVINICYAFHSVSRLLIPTKDVKIVKMHHLIELKRHYAT